MDFIKDVIIMINRSFLIVHGLSGSGEGHWQRWLYDKLKSIGEKVYFPDLPSSYTPKLDEWLETLKGAIGKMKGEKIVICHSMGAVLWLHYSNLKNITKVDRVLLVAPPSKSAIEKLDIDMKFLDFEVNKELLSKSSLKSILVVSDNDEYCPEKGSIYYGKELAVETIVFSDKAGHINIKSNYGEWYPVLVWCLNESGKIEEKESL